MLSYKGTFWQNTFRWASMTAHVNGPPYIQCNKAIWIFADVLNKDWFTCVFNHAPTACLFRNLANYLGSEPNSKLSVVI